MWNSKRKNLLLAIFAAALLGGIFFWYSNDFNGESNPMNTTYEIEGMPITLVDGISDVAAAPGSASRLVTKYFGNEVQGDFNGDGRKDIAFLLTQNGGGSGTFYYVAVAINTKGGYKGTNSVMLGDRISPQTTEYRDGEIIVNYADRGPEEPMTSPPSVGVSRYFKVQNGTLVEIRK